MDPTECLRQAREAYENGQLMAAALAYNDLDNWLSNGGFYPTPWLRAHL